jgi:hypothetical protein
MKILVCSLMLSCCVVASAAAEESLQMRRDRLMFCGQFEIQALDAMLVLDPKQYCCGIGNRFQNCPVHELDETQG